MFHTWKYVLFGRKVDETYDNYHKYHMPLIFKFSQFFNF